MCDLSLFAAFPAGGKAPAATQTSKRKLLGSGIAPFDASKPANAASPFSAMKSALNKRKSR